MRLDPHAGQAHVGIPRKSPISALRTEPEDFSGMANFSKAMLLRHHPSPLFNGAAFDFYRIAAALAD